MSEFLGWGKLILGHIQPTLSPHEKEQHSSEDKKSNPDDLRSRIGGAQFKQTNSERRTNP
jgi:hypothetical protein